MSKNEGKRMLSSIPPEKLQEAERSLLAELQRREHNLHAENRVASMSEMKRIAEDTLVNS